MKQRILDAAHADVPDLRDAIKASPRFQVEIKPRFATHLRLRPLQFASLLLVFVVALSFLFRSPTPLMPQVYATIYLEINPTLEIDIDARYDILEVRPMNPDAESLLSGFEDLKGQSFDITFDRLVEQAVTLEYLTKDRPIMMLDVSTTQLENRATVFNRVTDRVPELRERHDLEEIDIIEGDARNQTDEETDTAVTHDISVMRLRMIREIMSLDDTYEFDTLARWDASKLREWLEVLRKRQGTHDSISPDERPDDDDPSHIRPPNSDKPDTDAPPSDTDIGSGG